MGTLICLHDEGRSAKGSPFDLPADLPEARDRVSYGPRSLHRNLLVRKAEQLLQLVDAAPQAGHRPAKSRPPPASAFRATRPRWNRGDLLVQAAHWPCMGVGQTEQPRLLGVRQRQDQPDVTGGDALPPGDLQPLG